MFFEPSHKPKVIFTDNSLDLDCTCTCQRFETNGIAERAVRKMKKRMSASLLPNGESEKPLKVKSFRLVQWLNIIGFLRETSQSLTNLVKQFPGIFIEYVLIARKRRHYGCRHSRTGTDGRNGNLVSKNQLKRSVDDTKGTQFYIPRCRRNSKIVWKRPLTPGIHSKAGTTCKERKISEMNFKAIRKGLNRQKQKMTLKPDMTSGQFIVIRSNPRVQLHVPERRNILNSTEIHWRDQECPHKSGCDTRNPYWRLLVCRHGSKFVRFIEQDSRGAAYKKNMQLQDLKIWCLKCGSMSKAAQKMEKHEWAIEKPMIENARRWWGIYFIDPEDGEYRETTKNREEKVRDSDGGGDALQNGNSAQRRCWKPQSESDESNKIQKTKLAWHRGSSWIHEEAFGTHSTKRSWRSTSRRKIKIRKVIALEKLAAWQLDKVERITDVIFEGQRKRKRKSIVPYWWTSDISKNAELEPKYHWLCRTSSRRSIRVHPSKIGGRSKIAQISSVRMSNYRNVWIRLPRQKMAKIMGKHLRSCGTSGTNIFWSSVIGETVRRSFIRTWRGQSTQMGMHLSLIEKQGLFFVSTCGRH